MERKFKIHPRAISVTAKNRVLKDKNAVYTEQNFPDGQVDQLVKGGFLVEVTEKVSESTEKQTVKTAKKA